MKKNAGITSPFIPALGAFRPLPLPGNLPSQRLATCAGSLIVNLPEVFFLPEPSIVPLFSAEQGRAYAEITPIAGVTARELDAGNFAGNILGRCHFSPRTYNIIHGDREVKGKV